MSLKTQNQKRAEFVLKHIQSLKGSSYAEKLSSYILTNGLLPTLAFLKGKDLSFYKIIQEYFQHERNFLSNNEDLIQKLSNNDSSKLRIATLETLELSNWIRRLVKSESN